MNDLDNREFDFSDLGPDFEKRLDTFSKNLKSSAVGAGKSSPSSVPDNGSKGNGQSEQPKAAKTVTKPGEQPKQPSTLQAKGNSTDPKSNGAPPEPTMHSSPDVHMRYEKWSNESFKAAQAAKLTKPPPKAPPLPNPLKPKTP